jgi:hypothetical protein
MQVTLTASTERIALKDADSSVFWTIFELSVAEDVRSESLWNKRRLHGARSRCGGRSENELTRLRLDQGDVPSGIVLIGQQGDFSVLADSEAGVYRRHLLERCVQGCRFGIRVEEAN